MLINENSSKTELLSEIKRLKQENLFLKEEKIAFNTGPFVVFKWQYKDKWPVEYVSPNVIQLFGYSDREFVRGDVCYSDVLSGHDKPQVIMEVKQAYQDGVSEFSHKPYRIVRKDGVVRWLYDHTFVRRNINDTLFFYRYVFDITELKNIQKSLEDIQKRYEETQKLANLGSWTLEFKDNHFICSPEVYKIFNLDPGIAPVPYDMFLNCIYPDDREQVNQYFLDADTNLKPNELMHRLLLKDGTVRYVRERCVTSYDENNIAIRSVGSVQDISLFKNTELILEESCRNLQLNIDKSENILIEMRQKIKTGIEKQIKTDKKLREHQKQLYRCQKILNCVAELSKNFLLVGDWQSIMDRSLFLLGDASEVSRVYLFKHVVDSSDKSCMKQLFEWVDEGVSSQIENPGLKDFCWYQSELEVWYEKLLSNQVVIRQYSDFTEAEHRELACNNTTSILLVPLYVSNEFWGVIGFDECRAERNWTDIEVAALESAAGVIAGTIEREHAKQALRDSEQRFRGLVESTNDWIWEVDINGVYIYASPSVENILGYKPEKIIGKSFLEFIDVDEDFFNKNSLMNLLKQEAPFSGIENLHYHKNGSKIILESNGVPFFNDSGKLLGFRGINRDITERKHEEKNRLKQIKQQKNELVREVHHRIKNHLQGLMGLLKQKGHNDIKYQQIINETNTQIESIAIVYGLQAADNNAQIYFGQMIKAIIKSASGLTDTGIIVTQGGMQGCCEIDRSKAVALALVINELIVNAIKHQSAEFPSSKIFIHHEYCEGKIILTIQNDCGWMGKFDYDKGIGLGTGLELVKAMLPKKGAVLTINNQENSIIAKLIISSPLLVV